MGQSKKEKEIKPFSVKLDKKTVESNDDNTELLWHGQQPSEIEDETSRNGTLKGSRSVVKEVPGATSFRLKGTEAHKSSRDREDTQKVTSFQIFADADGTKYLGTAHAHNDGTATVRLKGQKKFKKLGSGSG
ncbi:hypothetical protein KC340_g11148 [Hortaea werneckii]|nr:hypothetical protein KC342_g11380 [Hortaea werneckii]KAI7085133.1 hypothetical protein KC339_g12958 [Hortaea werneckii]KAI7229542.1 hypothetical protein KC365_g7981 [Hortaea werneckii]KAI7308073.1 hypothetical protein KC340_g11148 [Hortaea werneckii]KAI7392752.1 hypothetical protein KC328_g6873 [Hortaea werneckii]